MQKTEAWKERDPIETSSLRVGIISVATKDVYYIFFDTNSPNRRILTACVCHPATPSPETSIRVTPCAHVLNLYECGPTSCKLTEGVCLLQSHSILTPPASPLLYQWPSGPCSHPLTNLSKTARPILMQLVNSGVPYNVSSVVYSFFSRKEAFCKIPAMISSIRSITKTARNYVQLALLFSANPGQSTSASCPNAQLSCSSGATTTNYCCFNYPGGLFLQTQFWDTNPPTGSSDSWTIHGLWSVHLWLLQIIFDFYKSSFQLTFSLGQTTAMAPMKRTVILPGSTRT